MTRPPLQWDEHGLPRSAEYGDVYHPRAGALQQARHVFLASNGLPQRWAGRDHFVVLETGFGLGNNFLATWQAWREDPQRSARLHFVSVERHPVTRDELAAVPRDDTLRELARPLAEAWPPLVPGTHRLAFDDGRVELLLTLGDVADWAAGLVLSADAVFLDGFAPARNPAMWTPRLMQAIARRCRPGTTAATWSSARDVRDALVGAGFRVESAAGSGGKRDITRAVYAPAFLAPAPPGRPTLRGVANQALIVGGGLAGCAAAMALAEQGWDSVVFDRHPAPAAEGSGNPAGLFHGTVHAEDGPHARWNRAAALQAQVAVAQAVAHDGVPGSAEGLLRIETATSLETMRELLARQELAPDYVQALDAAVASARAGIALSQPAWFYPGGGWVSPAALAASFLRRAGVSATWRGGTPIAALRRHGSQWALLDAAGATVAESSTVILANAAEALTLAQADTTPLEQLRGQLSGIPAAATPAGAPILPLSGQGYVLPAIDGRLWFGATSQADDPDDTLRTDDHRHNLARLATLTGVTPAVAAEDCTGRVGWRCSSRDRLPLIGALPDAGAAVDQLRFVTRQPGLFVFTGLGSRGITWAALGARVLASWVCGTPAPVEARLLEAVDPARFALRARRRADSVRARSSPAGAG
ncbi:MAG: FAD-dependent 5-carboxymethylaminomethyl-2-thiouridine(34) oxidoreductase MnmC [Piscinibacter sp.]|nr:FAD-dependent 5-carboxymethylaminomethyl-2-thiouridine(34) oxidoreductase MnmC [Piscinibacter sp.]